MSATIVRRSAIMTAAVAASALFLASCSSGGSSDPSDSATGSDSASAPTGVTLVMWHQSADADPQLNLYKAYEAASGNTIELVDLPADTYTTAVQTKWATGDRPDILEYVPTPQDMRQLNMSENMLDLSDLAFVGNRVNDAGELDGAVYGAVLGPLSSFGMFYNKDVLDAAGVDVPTSYGDLMTSCDAVTASGADMVNIGGGSEFPVNMFAGFAYMADYNEGDQWGQGVADGSIKVNDPEGPIVASLTTMKDLVDAGCVNSDAATATFQDSIAAVYDGSSALTILPSDFISLFYEAGGGDTATVDETIGFGPISAEKGIGSYSASPIGSYFVPSTGDATKEAAAKDFIDWITTEGYQDYVDEAQAVPTLTNATTPDLGGLYASLADVLMDPSTTPAFNQSVPGFGSFGQVSVSVLVGQASPQEAADTWQAYVDQAIEAQQ
ncbi:ABC transporter substrate-binding protein [Actinotalea sp. M2MS4P-6]|uniref:ABC transporter substrate-binding protein n=1 Tax=Actinotalea sp. M2MS4P-6 TaxID=2983762 RepID=UPI0021E47922|nr:ABC transporter substrate-binding protein [Actinotalea sp. M2MS4P-6]MCV2394347.1 ABC transporter substrate-binding protein [Actinotalea sp. M2MS4P-6]